MTKLPDRRLCLRYRFELRSQKYFGTIGVHPVTRVASEVFLQGGKAGSELEAAIRDAAICASKALEYGCPVAELGEAMTRLDNNAPAGPMGTLFDLLAADMKGNG